MKKQILGLIFISSLSACTLNFPVENSSKSPQEVGSTTVPEVRRTPVNLPPPPNPSNPQTIGVSTDTTHTNHSGSTTSTTSPHSNPTLVANNHNTDDFYIVMGQRYNVLRTSIGFVESGIASWYGDPFHGRKTSNGEVYDMYQMTAAHKHLPLPSMVEVTNVENGKRIVVRVNDRGPFVGTRVIDLSLAAAQALDMAEQGTAQVSIRGLDDHNQRLEQERYASATRPAFIQVGSYREINNARNFKQNLLRQGLSNTHVQQVRNRNGELMFRVQIGPLHSGAEYDQNIQRSLQTELTFMRKSNSLSNKLICLLFFCISSWSGINAASVVPEPPVIGAKNYLLIDANSGLILTEKNADERINPASITKIMTSYVVSDSIAQERINLQDEVFISENAYSAEGSRMFIEVNTKVSVEDLLNGLIVQSGNDAAIALAEHIAGSEKAFAELMNQYAKELGLSNTNYANSTGFTAENHYTTARDIATLSQALISKFPKDYELYKRKEFSYNGIDQKNRNSLLWRDDDIDGIKTGHTEAAGYCLAASAIKNNMRLISVVLGTKSSNARISASQTLLNYGFRFYESELLYTPDKDIMQQKIWKAEQEEIGLRVNKPVHVTIPRGRYRDLKISSNIPNQIIAPLNVNSEIGMLEIRLDDLLIAQSKLYPAEAVAEASFFKRTIDSVKLWFAD